MTSRMSSRERMFAALTRQGPDHVPLSLYIAQGPLYKPPFFWRNQIERAERLLQLGLDPTIDIWFPDPQMHRDVEVKTWRERHGDDTLLIKEYHTPAGVLRQVVRETADWCSIGHGPWIPTTWGTEVSLQYGMYLFDDWCISRRVEPWVKGREDLDKLRYIIRPAEGYVLDEWRMDAERALDYARRFDVLTTARRTIVGDAFQWFCDIPWFMVQLYDDPAFVEEFLDIFQEWSLSLVQLGLKLGVDLIQYRGWYEPARFWGRKGWKRFIAPRLEAQARMVHAGGKLHGYLLTEDVGVLAAELRDMGVDVLQGIDPRVLGSSLREMADTLEGRKAFWGGVNAEVTLLSGDLDQIDVEVKDAIEILASDGGLVLSTLLFPDIPETSVVQMIDSWKKYRYLTADS